MLQFTVVKILQNHNYETDSRGVYKGLATHRFQARKDLYSQKYIDIIKKANQGKDAGEKLKRPNMVRLAIEPSVKALLNYREGNAEVLAEAAQRIQKEKMILL